MGTQIKAEIVAHSINEQGDELISVLATFPRIILAEVNTHRMLSKNTSSSRAIPFKKMVETIGADPFIPIAWQRGHSGMQGSEYLTAPIDIAFAHDLWLEARDRAVRSAMALSKEGTDKIPFVTKQLANRLLEPFMWTTMLITGPKSGWDNFFKLRCPVYYIEGCDYVTWKDTGLDANTSILEKLKVNKGQAEIHMMALAECIYDAYSESTPKVLKPGEWHIPFEDKINIPLEGTEFATEVELQEYKIKVSVAMAARTSYTVVGEEKEINYEAMIGLHDRLLAQDPPHSSPLEHCARAMSNEEFVSFTKTIHSTSNKVEKTDQGGLRQGEVLVNDFVVNREEHYGWCNNFKGFIPYRYMVDNAQL